VTHLFTFGARDPGASPCGPRFDLAGAVDGPLESPDPTDPRDPVRTGSAALPTAAAGATDPLLGARLTWGCAAAALAVDGGWHDACCACE
jgi:hypothetical protein